MKKKRLLGIMVTILLLVGSLMGCGNGKFEDMILDVPRIDVSSTSINADGKLLTFTASDKNPNNPKGGNKSPALKWIKVDNAACYAAYR